MPGNAAVIELLQARGIPCIRGNHDEFNDVELSAPVEEPRVSAPPSDFDETLVSSGTAAVSTAAFAAAFTSGSPDMPR